jgi:hypothetical protein
VAPRYYEMILKKKNPAADYWPFLTKDKLKTWWLKVYVRFLSLSLLSLLCSHRMYALVLSLSLSFLCVRFFIFDVLCLWLSLQVDWSRWVDEDEVEEKENINLSGAGQSFNLDDLDTNWSDEEVEDEEGDDLPPLE